MKIIFSKKADSQAYNKSKFMTTHNSYGWSIIKQLEKGIRGFELDIHDTWTLPEILLGKISGGRYKGKFKVGHGWPGHEVYREGGNPRGDNLEKWLGKIGDWSRENEGHPPITVFLDIKKNLIDSNNNPSEQFGLIRFNEQILNVFKNDTARLFTPEDFTRFYEKQNSWPTIGDLRNKIIVVLMSFHITTLEEGLRKKPTFIKKVIGSVVRLWKELPLHPVVDPLGALKTRVAYQEGRIKSDKDFDPICFVTFNPQDPGETGFEASLEKKSIFVTPYPPEIFEAYWKKDKIVRTDYKKLKNGSWPTFPEFVNFPATDNWKDDDDGYLNATTKWMI